MDLGITELERVHCREVDDCGDKIIDSGILDSYILHEEYNRNQSRAYMTPSEMEVLMQDTMKLSVNIATNRIVTRILKETIEGTFTVGWANRTKKSGPNQNHGGTSVDWHHKRR